MIDNWRALWVGLILLSPILLLAAPVLIAVYWPSRRAYQGFAALVALIALGIGALALFAQWQK